MFCINSELFSGCFFLEKQMRTKKKKKKINHENGCKTLSYCDQIQEPHCGVCAGVRGSRGPVLGSPQEPPAPKRPSARGGVLGAAAQECSWHPSRPCWGRIGICTLGIMRDVPGPKQGGRPTAPAVLWGWCPSAPGAAPGPAVLRGSWTWCVESSLLGPGRAAGHGPVNAK